MQKKKKKIIPAMISIDVSCDKPTNMILQTYESANVTRGSSIKFLNAQAI